MNQLTRLFSKTIALLFLIALISSPEFLFAADGESLFKANCASCHKPDATYVGPALKGAREREPSKDWVYKWVANTTTMVNTDPYAATLKSAAGGTVMTAFPGLKKEEIDAILDWANKYEAPTGTKGVAADASGTTSDNSILYGLLTLTSYLSESLLL